MILSYVNGCYTEHHKSVISIDDRSIQFADSVYEVICIVNGKLIDADAHIKRLFFSLRELAINVDYTHQSLLLICFELIKKNRIVDGSLYIQITRGIQKRAHIYSSSIKPSLIITASHQNFDFQDIHLRGVKVITHDDIRWKRPDIKSTALLPNILLKKKASENNAFECWLFDEEKNITEACVMNVWIIKDNTLITPPALGQILDGITKNRIKEICSLENLAFKENSFSINDAKSADEAFMSASTSHIVPVIKIDDSQISSGTPGLITKKIQRLYQNYLIS